MDEARDLLAASAGDEEAVFLPPSALPKLTIEDIPEETFIEIGILKDGGVHIEWSGPTVPRR